MALSQRLQLRQTQSLVMTPQLLQAIKLLQLSHLDLTAYVENEIERNPLLEREAGEEAAGGEPEAVDAVDGQTATDSAQPDWLSDEFETSRAALEKNLDTDLENVFPDEPRRLPRVRRFSRNLIPTGRRRTGMGATTTTTISKPSSPRNRRWPTTSPSS